MDGVIPTFQNVIAYHRLTVGDIVDNLLRLAFSRKPLVVVYHSREPIRARMTSFPHLRLTISPRSQMNLSKWMRNLLQNNVLTFC